MMDTKIGEVYSQIINLPLTSVPSYLMGRPEVGQFIESAKGRQWLENLTIKSAYHPNSQKTLDMIRGYGMEANTTNALDFRTAIVKNMFNPSHMDVKRARHDLTQHIWY